MGSTILSGYRLVYKGESDGSSYLTIEKDETSYVPLGIFEISNKDERKLDKYEEYPKLYHKKSVTLTLNGKKIDTLIYIMNDKFDYHLPTRTYIETCEDGYNDFNFNKQLLYVALRYTLMNKSKQKTK